MLSVRSASPSDVTMRKMVPYAPVLSAGPPTLQQRCIGGARRPPGLARPAVDRHDGDVGRQLATTTDGHPRSEPMAGITGNTKTRSHTDCKSVGVCLQWFESTTCHRRSSMVSSPLAFDSDPSTWRSACKATDHALT